MGQDVQGDVCLIPALHRLGTFTVSQTQAVRCSRFEHYVPRPAHGLHQSMEPNFPPLFLAGDIPPTRQSRHTTHVLACMIQMHPRSGRGGMTGPDSPLGQSRFESRWLMCNGGFEVYDLGVLRASLVGVGHPSRSSRLVAVRVCLDDDNVRDVPAPVRFGVSNLVENKMRIPPLLRLLEKNEHSPPSCSPPHVHDQRTMTTNLAPCTPTPAIFHAPPPQ